MKKILKYALYVVVACAVVFGVYASYKYNSGPEVAVAPVAPEVSADSTAGKLNSEGKLGWATLQYDIRVNENLACICDDRKTGFDVTVGPTGWPVGSSLEWEVALYEGSDAYYARLILHEYMLWWSWDDPYIAVKIPKKNVSGNPWSDEKFRWDMLWTITHATGRSYNYSPYINNANVRAINGHTVAFGRYGCHYEKYLVISDYSCDW